MSFLFGLQFVLQIWSTIVYDFICIFLPTFFFERFAYFLSENTIMI